ncbi:MAG: PD-(D/E)XK nuclease family protein [Thermoplasmata archaeon]
MLKLIFQDPAKFLINNYKNYDAIILPDQILKRNLEIYFNKSNNEDIPDNIFTIFSLAKEISGKNLILLPRFLERELAHLSLKDINYYRDLHDNEHFITDLLNEYWEIKENILAGKEINDNSKFFEAFDRNFSCYLKKLKEGIIIENNVYYIYPKEEVIFLLIDNLKEKLKNIIFCCFYYVNPTLKKFIDDFKNDLEISFLIEPMFMEPAKDLLNRLEPLDLEKREMEMPKNVKVIALPDQRREIKYIANYILEQTYNGYSYSDFIVAFPNVKEYEQYVDEIFNLYKIPYFLESRKKIIELPLSSILIDKLKDKNFESIENFINALLVEFNNTIDSETSENLINVGKVFKSIKEFKNEMIILEKYFKLKLNYIESFKSFISIYNFGQNIENLNAVQIIDLGNISFRKSKNIIIGGLNENNFPQFYRNKIIFPEIYSLKKIYFRTMELHKNIDLYRIGSIFSYGQVFLFTYPYLDLEGKRYLESYFIRKMENELGIKFERENESASSLIYGKVLFHEKDLMINNAIYNNIKNQNEYNLECNQELKNLVSKIDLTPTHITTYNTCPRKFYYRYVLKLEIPVKVFSPTYMGTIVHDVLKKFYEKYDNLLELNDLVQNNEIRLKNIIDQIIGSIEVDQKINEEFKIHLEAIKRYVIRAIKNDLSIDYSRKVIAREKEFNLEISGRLIKGRIDRIDKLGNAYVLMDYKYSSISHVRDLFIQNEEDIKPEKDLSLPIYMMWLEKNYSPESFVAFYFPIRARLKKQKKWLYLYTKNFRSTSKGWTYYVKNNVWNEKFKRVITDKILDIIDGIKNCEFPIIENESICRQCEFRYICKGDL